MFNVYIKCIAYSVIVHYTYITFLHIPIIFNYSLICPTFSNIIIHHVRYNAIDNWSYNKNSIFFFFCIIKSGYSAQYINNELCENDSWVQYIKHTFNNHTCISKYNFRYNYNIVCIER